MTKSFLLVLSLFGGLAVAQTTTTLTETPRAADSLVDSIGVNTHIFFLDTAYGNSLAVQQMLSMLRVRHIRDGAMYYPKDPAFDQQEFLAYGKVGALGVGFDLILDPNTSPPMSPTVMSTIQSLAARYNVPVDSYEGPNEIDISGDSNWVADTRSFMQSTYSSVKANASTSSIPVLGNTLAGSPQDWVALGNMTKVEDFGNMHPYANTQQPSYNFAAALANQINVSGSQPIYVTEAGWSNATHATDNSPNVTEDVSARYIARLFFETLLRGWPRTYVYELVDDKADPGLASFQRHFGLFRNDYSPKPAATAVSNLVVLMSDRNQTFTPVPFSYSLTTASSNVHHLLFQKHDGSYWLALWQEVSNWKGWDAQGTPVINPDVEVTLNLSGAAASIQTYKPLISTTVVQSFSNRQSINLMIPDHPLLVQISSVAPVADLRVTSIQ